MEALEAVIRFVETTFIIISTCNAYSVLSTVLGILLISMFIILNTTLWTRYYVTPYCRQLNWITRRLSSLLWVTLRSWFKFRQWGFRVFELHGLILKHLVIYFLSFAFLSLLIFHTFPSLLSSFFFLPFFFPRIFKE